MQAKPLFNKRLYKAHANITISKDAGEILQRNPTITRSEADLRTIRSVITGLKDIHKGFEFAKTALGHAVTFEKHKSDVRIEKQQDEPKLSCYYILNGSVESFYTVGNMATREFHENTGRSVSYTNVAGDYIGSVSADGANFDFPSPDWMNTIEHSEFLRVDRKIFHAKILEAQQLFRDELVAFLDTNSLFATITNDDRLTLLSQMVKQEFPAGKQILSQGQKQEHAFFISEGRCVYYRRLYLLKQKRSELFRIGYVEKGSYFDASCVIDDQNSKFSVNAVGPVTCYLLNKWTIKNSESLLRALTVGRPLFSSDKDIESFIEKSDQWHSYKRDMVRDAFVLKPHLATLRIIPQSLIPRALAVAIRHGSLLRQQQKKALFTSPNDGLNLRRRKSEKSSNETREGTQSALDFESVMLMKRSRSSTQMENEKVKTENDRVKTQTDNGNINNGSVTTDHENAKTGNGDGKMRNDNVRTQHNSTGTKNDNVKTLNANVRTQNGKGKTKNNKNNTQHSDAKMDNGNLEKKPASEPKGVKSASKFNLKRSAALNSDMRWSRNRTGQKQSKDTPLKQNLKDCKNNTCKRNFFKPSLPNGNREFGGNSVGVKNTRVEAPEINCPNASRSPNARADGKKKPESERDERWIASYKRFEVKEIVNTRIPGKETPVDEYQRFEPSMFACIDEINKFEKEKATDPFIGKREATAWLKRAREKISACGSLAYNPGKSPIIVIEEFRPVGLGNEGEQETGHGSEKRRQIGAVSLETLLEDSEKENAAEEMKKNEWTTLVHETRYEAERSLERARTDIAMLEGELKKLGWKREVLFEKERKGNEQKTTRSFKTAGNEEKTTEGKIEQKKIEENPTKPTERRIRTLKRQESIQKILEDHSKKVHMKRTYSYFDEKHAKKESVGFTKRSSSGVNLYTTQILKRRTSTIS